MPLGFGGRRIVVRVHELPCANAPAGVHIETRFRHVGSLDHGELCRAFGYDPIRTKFDLPRSAFGTDHSGAGSRRTGTVDGYVLFNGEPIARVHVAHESERHRDVDPEELAR